MSNPTEGGAHAPAVHQPSIPEWDQNAAASSAGVGTAKTEAGGHAATIAKPTLRDRFDAVVPPGRSYLGLRRRWFLLAVLGVFLAVIALVIGLAVGLTAGHGSGGYARLEAVIKSTVLTCR